MRVTVTQRDAIITHRVANVTPMTTFITLRA
jgi:hypothetical protein